MNQQTCEHILHLLRTMELDHNPVLKADHPFPRRLEEITMRIVTQTEEGTETHYVTLPEDFQFPGMSLDTYQEAVTRTCATSDPCETVKLALIGMLGELGEIAEPNKKHLWGGHDVDVTHLQEEVGDLLWYLATLCNALDIRLQQAIEDNIEKLQTRYPDGFSQENSVNRAL